VQDGAGCGAIFLALGSLKQQEHKFEASLGYIVSKSQVKLGYVVKTLSQ
jgi:hypothetical protein